MRPNHSPLERLLTHRAGIVASVHRRFPQRCQSEVDDAAQVAAEKLWLRPAVVQAALDRGGDAELRRLYVVIMWRALFQVIRTEARRQTWSTEIPPEQVFAITPDEELIAAEILASLPSLTQVAAETFCRRHPEALTRALAERLYSLESDKAIAARHNVTRETLCRAKNWLVTRASAVTLHTRAA